MTNKVSHSLLDDYHRYGSDHHFGTRRDHHFGTGSDHHFSTWRDYPTTGDDDACPTAHRPDRCRLPGYPGFLSDQR